MHLVSCKHNTSGLVALMNLATRLMRKRTELMFQVVRERRMRTGRAGRRQDDACLPAAIKNEFRKTRSANRGNRLSWIGGGPICPQPGGNVRSVKSILNMPGSIFLDVSRL